jgi:hypothetical protein
VLEEERSSDCVKNPVLARLVDALAPEVLSSSDKMGVLLIASCSLVAFGPLAGLLLFVISKQKHLAIFALASAFAWIITSMLTSLVWSMTQYFAPWHWLALVLSAVIQSTCRLYLVSGCIKLEKLIAEDADSTRAAALLPLNDTALALGKLPSHCLRDHLKCRLQHVMFHSCMRD